MVPIPDTGASNKVWSCDVLGPLRTTRRRNRFLLVFINHFTKWVEAFPTPYVESHKVAEHFINDIVFRHGCPEALLPYQGTNFTSKLIKDVTRLLVCRKLQGTPYHPQNQTAVERTNRIMLLILRSYTNDAGGDWDLHMPYALFACRTYVQSSTGFTPFELLYGREPRLPIDVELNHMLRSLNDPRDYRMRLANQLATTQPQAEARLRITQAHQRQKAHRKPVSL